MNLFERIQLVCNIKNITPTLIEREVGLSEGAILKWSYVRPSADKLKDVATFLNCSISFLLRDDSLPLKNDRNQLGNALRKEREKKNLSNIELSKLSKLPIDIICAYEAGASRVSEYLLRVICHALSLSLSEFLLDHNLYDDCVPKCFNGDANKYEAYKKALEYDDQCFRI